MRDIINFDSDEEIEEFEFSNSAQIFSKTSDPTIKGLYDKYKKGILDVQPDFQRDFVWDINKASKLVESVFLSIPLPTIYLSEGSDTDYVIDGQQRLTSFFSFIDGKLPNGQKFVLKGLKKLTELNHHSYKDLPLKQQDVFDSFGIRSVTFLKNSNPNLKFEIFERLNTGSMQLNAQELRNCIYRGTYNELLKKLTSNQCFRQMTGLKTNERRMKDVELVLRFSSFLNQTYLNYSSPMKSFMNNEMEIGKSYTNEQFLEIENKFKHSIDIIYSMLGTKAFKKFEAGSANNVNGNWEKQKFNASLFDVLMFGFTRHNKNTLMRNIDSIREALINLMSNDREFIDSIEKGTSSKKAVDYRFKKWIDTIDEIIKNDETQKRCFSREFKQKLFDSNSTCSLCNQYITEIDDAAVDHIEHYWKGGRTIPENARLTHRYCNQARPYREVA